MSLGHFDFFAYWLSYKHFKMTPRCPMYQGVAIVDLLMIQNSPKYRGVKTPQCHMYRGVKTLKYFVSQNSPVSYVPGSRKT